MERFRDLPVSLDLPGTVAQEVARYVETEAGWQVVAAGGPPTPALTLSARPLAGCSCVVLVEGTPSPEQVREGLLAGALDVLGWPADRARLLEAPGRLAGPRVPARPRLLRVSGAGGGAGASTVALALGGLAAWRGLRTAVVGGEDLLALCGLGGWAGPGAAELSALGPEGAGAEFVAVARPVAGVDALSVLAGDGAALQDCGGWPVDLVVADGRQDLDRPAVVVARPDASLRRVAGLEPPALVLVAGRGPLDPAGAQRCLGRRPDAWLPFSARVARAGLAGRVPSALPASWLAALQHPLAPLRRAS